jgi:hypothetical protein
VSPVTSGSSRCDRILALIDACLDEVGALLDERDEPAAPVPVGSAQEGGPAS